MPTIAAVNVVTVVTVVCLELEACEFLFCARLSSL